MENESCLIKALKRISQWVQLHDPQPSIMYPGLSYLEIQKLTQKLPFQLPLEVCELFHFCNGGLGITPDLVTYSLERSIESCFWYEEDDDGRYKLPLFSQNEIYYVLCPPLKKGINPVWCQFPEFKGEIYASSLTSLMLTSAECYETGAYYVEDCYVKIGARAYLAEDRDKVELIFEKYNPQYIDTWRSIWKD